MTAMTHPKLNTASMGVLDYIHEHGSITTYEAFEYLGVTRLAALIHFLAKRYGYNFMKKRECVKNRFGKCVPYTRYSLLEENGDGNEVTGS